MEAKKLMTGDLIRWSPNLCLTDEDKAPLTVTCIGEPEYPDYMPFVKVKNGSNEKYNQDLFEPIPFTINSAKKNNLIDCGDDIYQDDEWRWGIDFRNNEFYTFDEDVENTIKPILFYHELQHALRLVGLDNVADNLKV